MSEAPDKIYVLMDESTGFLSHTFTNVPCEYGGAKKDVEYICKDIVDETVEVAEDHAYFAGKEKLREALLEWAKEKLDKSYGGSTDFHYGLAYAYACLIEKLEEL